MIKEKMILAEPDVIYLMKIHYKIMKKAPQIDLITFTATDQLREYLENGGTAGIIVVDECFVEEWLKSLTSTMIRIVLMSEMLSLEGFVAVKKNQRPEHLIDFIISKCLANKGLAIGAFENRNTETAVFYSPSGGSGKTTLALGMATGGAKAGYRILYLNLEEINSEKYLLAATSGNLSDVFLALKMKEINIDHILKKCTGLEQTAGFFYILGVDSASEFENIDENDIKKLLEKIESLHYYDLIIVDLSSGFHKKNKAVMERADIIFLPVLLDEGSIFKLQRLIEEMSLHDKDLDLFQKMHIVVNKTDVGGRRFDLLPFNICEKIPFCAEIKSNFLFVKQSNIFQSGNMLLEIMNPLFRTLNDG